MYLPLKGSRPSPLREGLESLELVKQEVRNR